MKLILGTAQLGLPYGITNNTGILSEDKSLELLHHAIKNNITTFDTARAYGKSEYLLGKINKKICIITKLLLPDDIHTYNNNKIIKEINKSINTSIKNINRSTINILLLHKYSHYLLKNKIIWNHLIKLKNEKIIEKIGVSIYNVHEANKLLKDSNVDVIQIPLNILDHQWFDSTFLEMVNKRKDIQIFCRSIFLQGILISPRDKWPRININADEYINKLNKLVDKYNLKNRKELVISYVNSIEWISGIIIGVDNIKQLVENINLFKIKKIKYDDINYINNFFSNVPPRLINPSLWK